MIGVAMIGEQWVTDRPGGMNRYVANLHRHLRPVGVDVTTFVLGGRPGPAPAGVVVAANTDDSKIRRVASMRRAVRRSGPFDIVDVHFAAFAAGALIMPRPNRLVVHFHGPWADESAAEGAPKRVVSARRRVERFVYGQADAVVTESEAFAEIATADYSIPRKRIHVIRPGVDTTRFGDGGPEGRVSARLRLGVDPERFLVVCVRRLVARMGIELLIDAWTQVLAASPDAELVIVGDGPLGPALRERAMVMIGDRPRTIRFTGRVDDHTLVDWYRAANLTVVPSVALEGYGLVVMESLACGRPVVVSDVGGLPEAVVALGPRFVVPAGDTAEWGARLAAAATGTLPLPSAAQCRAATKTDWSQVATRHLDLYRSLLGRAR